MQLDALTPMQKQQAMLCRTPEQLFAFAKSEGFPLSTEELKGNVKGEWETCDEKEEDPDWC